METKTTAREELIAKVLECFDKEAAFCQHAPIEEVARALLEENFYEVRSCDHHLCQIGGASLEENGHYEAGDKLRDEYTLMFLSLNDPADQDFSLKDEGELTDLICSSPTRLFRGISLSYSACLDGNIDATGLSSVVEEPTCPDVDGLAQIDAHLSDQLLRKGRSKPKRSERRR